MSVGFPTAGAWSSSQWRPDNEFETDRWPPGRVPVPGATRGGVGGFVRRGSGCGRGGGTARRGPTVGLAVSGWGRPCGDMPGDSALCHPREPREADGWSRDNRPITGR